MQSGDNIRYLGQCSMERAWWTNSSMAWGDSAKPKILFSKFSITAKEHLEQYPLIYTFIGIFFEIFERWLREITHRKAVTLHEMVCKQCRKCSNTQSRHANYLSGYVVCDEAPKFCTVDVNLHSHWINLNQHQAWQWAYSPEQVQNVWMF